MSIYLRSVTLPVTGPKAEFQPCSPISLRLVSYRIKRLQASFCQYTLVVCDTAHYRLLRRPRIPPVDCPARCVSLWIQSLFPCFYDKLLDYLHLVHDQRLRWQPLPS